MDMLSGRKNHKVFTVNPEIFFRENGNEEKTKNYVTEASLEDTSVERIGDG